MTLFQWDIDDNIIKFPLVWLIVLANRKARVKLRCRSNFSNDIVHIIGLHKPKCVPLNKKSRKPPKSHDISYQIGMSVVIHVNNFANKVDDKPVTADF